MKRVSEGYLAASVDSIRISAQVMRASGYTGSRIQSVEILGAANKSAAPDFYGLRTKWFESQEISFKRYQSWRNEILRRLENGGYPFSGVGLEIAGLRENAVSGFINVKPGPLITYDTLALGGNHGVKQRFLEGVIGVKSGGVYNEKALEQAPRVLGGLSYLKLITGPEVRFLNNERARVDLILEKRKASAFDLIVGFLPNASRNGGFLVTGLLNLDLVNPFGTGKEFSLSWSRLEVQTQRFQASAKLPYLFSSPLGVDLGVDLYKFDSLYLDLNWNAGISFNLDGKSSLSGMVKNHSTFVLNVDSNVFKGSGLLPAIQDIRNNHFGLRFQYSSLDFKPSPREGLFLNVYGLAGFRRINRNQDIEALTNAQTDETYGEIYDRIDLRSSRTEWGLDLDYFQPISLRSVLNIGIEARALVAKDIFFNEKYRIGGTNSLRGFNEESLFTSYYTIANFEYRFLLSRSS
jgi:outer membrane protein assembly factor BamA